MRGVRTIFVLMAIATMACRCSIDFGDDKPKSSPSYSSYSRPELPNPVSQFKNNMIITPAVVMIIAAIYMARTYTMTKDQPKNGSYYFCQFILPIGSILLCAYQSFFPALAPTGMLTFLPSFIGGIVMIIIVFISSMWGRERWKIKQASASH